MVKIRGMWVPPWPGVSTHPQLPHPLAPPSYRPRPDGTQTLTIHLPGEEASDVLNFVLKVRGARARADSGISKTVIISVLSTALNFRPKIPFPG